MNFKDEAIIRTGAERLSNKTITLRQEIFQGGKCCVKAIIVECYFDAKARTSMEMPQHDRELYGNLMFNLD